MHWVALTVYPNYIPFLAAPIPISLDPMPCPSFCTCIVLHRAMGPPLHRRFHHRGSLSGWISVAKFLSVSARSKWQNLSFGAPDLKEPCYIISIRWQKWPVPHCDDLATNAAAVNWILGNLWEPRKNAMLVRESGKSQNWERHFGRQERRSGGGVKRAA